MESLADKHTRQDADSNESELCSNFHTAVQVFSSPEATPTLHPKHASSSRRRVKPDRRHGRINIASSCTLRPHHANSSSASATQYLSVESECSDFHAATQAFPSLDATHALHPEPANSTPASASQYYSARIQWMIENWSKYTDQVEFETECSKVHRTRVERGGGRTEKKTAAQEDVGSACSSGDENEDEEEDEGELDEEVLKANREAMKEQRQHRAWGRVFQELRDTLCEIREKIGQGGEAKIYAGIHTYG